MNQQQQQEHLHSLNLKQNAGYHILDETQNAAIGFSPTAPDKLVIWNRNSDGDYISGHYGSTVNLSEANDLLFRGFDMEKVTGILNDIGFDYSENRKFNSIGFPNYTNTHIISAAHTHTGAEVFEELKSKFVAQQGGTPIAPHITEIFNDSIPEERKLGLAMGIDYLHKADELWVFGDKISSGMAAEILIAQDELKIPIYHVDDKTYEKVLFNEYKALQPINQNTNNKEVLPMAENFTRDQLNRAKDVDLLNYVQTHGYTVKAHGTCYKLIEDGHDSTVIFPSTNSWSNMASGIGGDIVSFLVKHEGKDMVSAVKELIGETFDPQKMFEKFKENILPKEPLVLPPKAADNRRVYAYLLQTRGLDRDIVHQAIHDGAIYQSKETIAKGDKEYIFNNCIFVGKDDAGTAQYASQRSMNDNSTFNFKQDVKNSNKAFGFRLPGKATADWLTVCEAPIDALSIASLNKLKGLSIDYE